MFQGRTAAEAGLIFGKNNIKRDAGDFSSTGTTNEEGIAGHENMGIVDQVGSGVTLLKKGDRVVMPFNVADGRCLNCEEGNTAYCTGVNPGFAGGAYGYVAMVCLFGATPFNPGSAFSMIDMFRNSPSFLNQNSKLSRNDEC